MTRLLLASLAALAVAAPAAQAAPDRLVTVDAPTPVAWTGAAALGLNNTFYEGARTGRSACGKTPETYCDTTLVRVDPLATKKSLTFRIDGFSQAADFDLRVSKSDETGADKGYIGDPTGERNGPLGPAISTFNGDFENLTISGVKAGSYYLVQVVYFFVPNESYKGTVTLK